MIPVIVALCVSLSTLVLSAIILRRAASCQDRMETLDEALDHLQERVSFLMKQITQMEKNWGVRK